MTNDDMDLVRRYAHGGSEEAFAALVSRHVSLVHSAAMRRVRDAHLAEEVTQTVFLVLARKARELGPTTVVPGWLHRTTCFVSAKALEIRRRRQLREQEAFMQSQLNDPGSDAGVWRQIEPILEDAVAALGAADRDAVVLRFFEGRSFKEVAAAMGASEAAAKMRVQRALEKLRTAFARRGLTVSAAVIAEAVSMHSIQAAPAGLASSVTLAAMHNTPAATPALLKTTLQFMAWTKIKSAAVAGILILLAGGAAAVCTGRAMRAGSTTGAMAFAGFATPEASVQSMLWAGNRGDFNGLLAGCTMEQADRFKSSMAGKTDEEVRAATMAWARALSDYKITQSEVVSPDEVHLHIHATPSNDGLRNGKVIVVMRKIGNDWKQSGDL
jgi:RNA polymerase sigma factor (sigma-70 family)